MLRLCGAVNHMPAEGRRSDRRKAVEGNKRTGRGGGEGKLLAVAEEEGQVVGKEHLSQTPAAEGGRETFKLLQVSVTSK